MPFAVTNQTIGAAGTLEDSFVAPTASRPNDFTPLNPSVVNVVNVAIAPPAPTTGTLATTIEYAQGIVSESVAEYGVQETPVVITLLETLEDAALLAEYLIRSAPAFWFGNIQIIMNGLTDAQRTIINSLDIGSQISVTKSFPNSTPSTVTQLMALEGISHDITPDRHIVTLYPNPARIYTYFIVGGYPVATSRTNLVTNPNLETDVNFWSAATAGTTFVRSSTQKYVGSWSGQWDYPSTVASPVLVAAPGAFSQRIPVNAGLTYTASFYVYTSVAGSYRMDLRWATAITGGSLTDTTGTASTITANTWTRYTVTGTCPVGYSFVQINLSRLSNTVTGTTFVDAALFETASSALPYFDGTFVADYTGFGLASKAWNGTADASTSTASWFVGNTRTNLVTNPSFETNTTGWSAFNCTLTRVAGTIGSGSWLGEVAFTATGVGNSIFTSTITVTAGLSYTLSTYALRTVGTGSYAILINWYNGATLLSDARSTTQACATTTRLTVTGTAPATANNARIYFYSATSSAIGDKVQVDAFLFEQASTLLPYFDGTYADTYTGYTLTAQGWNGTADASTSTGTWGLTSAFVGSQLDDDTKGLG